MNLEKKFRVVALTAVGAARGSAFASASTAAAQPGQIGTVWYIAMENHNFTQPVPTNSPHQLVNNPAAPYINSLVTPGNANAAQSSYATNYTNAGVGVHPSEPNYVWAEAGTDFGVHTDNDPCAACNNIFTANHLTAQMNAAGVSWNNYQEDVQLGDRADAPRLGHHRSRQLRTTAPRQYNYAVKHNPMAFFSRHRDAERQDLQPAHDRHRQ